MLVSTRTLLQKLACDCLEKAAGDLIEAGIQFRDEAMTYIETAGRWPSKLSPGRPCNRESPTK
jgi:hypothetical protein